MSLKYFSSDFIPAHTARVARAAFPKGNVYLKLRDEFGTIYDDSDFESLFPLRGRPAESPVRLALIVIFQFLEGLSDRAAADAVRSRIDWKYALGLELEDAGFDASILTEFRARLIKECVFRSKLNTYFAQSELPHFWCKRTAVGRTSALCKFNFSNHLFKIGATRVLSRDQNSLVRTSGV